MLSLYHAENVFDLVFMGKSRAVALDRLQHWRKFLGTWAAKLTHVQSAFKHSFSYHNGTYLQVEDIMVYVRLDSARGGALMARRFSEEDRYAVYCSCDLSLRLPGRVYSAKDGNRLLDLLQDCMKDFYDDMGVEKVACESCRLPTVFGPGGYLHQQSTRVRR